MKVIQYNGYGDAEVIALQHVEKPVLKENEVLIRVSATSINPLDIKIRSGMMQKILPVKLPFIPGMDASGIIEATGSKVTRLKTGDEVYAATTKGGTYAEYLPIEANLVALKPNNVSFNEAAGLAIPFVTAYTFLIDEAGVKAGQRILIQGAAGGVGQVMLQVAKALDLYVTATASGEGLELLKSLGADEIIDYKHQDFTQVAKDIDLVIDLVGGETQTKSFGIVNKGGTLLSAAMPPDQELAKQFGINARFVDGIPSYCKLEFGSHLVDTGKIRTNVAKVMKLEEAAAAQDLVSKGGLNGKLVLTVS